MEKKEMSAFISSLNKTLSYCGCRIGVILTLNLGPCSVN